MFILSNGYTQNQDSLVQSADVKNDSARVYYFYANSCDTSLSFNKYHIDTLLENCHVYDPAYEYSEFIQKQGNTGLANKNMKFGINDNIDFDYGYHAFDSYLFTPQNSKFYYSIAPYTQLKFFTGSRHDQFFEVIHSHTIKNRLTVAADYRIINSLGRDFFREKADNVNAMFSAYYMTKNKRYGFFATYLYNRIKCYDNGGIVSDSLYENNRTGNNITQFEYNLISAGNIMKNNTFFLKQYFDLNFRKTDTSGIHTRGSAFGRLSVITSIDKPRFIYYDEDVQSDSSYYFNIYTDSTEIKDSVRFLKWSNSILWTSNEFNSFNKPNKFRMFAGLSHHYIEVHPLSSPFYNNQLIAQVGLSLNLNNNINLYSSGEYVVMFYKTGDYKVNAGLKCSLNKNKGVIRLSGGYVYKHPDWTSEYFYSGLFRWSRNYFSEKITSACLDYKYKLFAAGAEWNGLIDYVYYDTCASSVQNVAGNINVLSAYIKKDFVLGKFRIDNYFVAQYTDNDNVIALPLFMTKQSFSFKFDLFKKALTAQPGIDLWYNTSYYADAWMPVTQQFYQQRERRIGNYPYIDAFINFKVKRAYIFVMFSHVNSGFMGYNYYLVPHYPFADRSFRFGVNWKFHD